MSVLKLNIYERNKIIKTYECADYDMSFGILEDLLGLAESIDNEKEMFKHMGMLRPFMKEIFVDLTDDEMRKVRVKDVFAMMQNAMAFAVGQLGGDESDPNV